MTALENHDNPKRPSRWRDEPPPSPRVLKLALIAAAIILIIGVLLYLKARRSPPALHDQLMPGATASNAVRRA